MFNKDCVSQGNEDYNQERTGEYQTNTLKEAIDVIKKLKVSVGKSRNNQYK